MGRGYSEVEDAKIYWEAPLAFTIWSDKGPLFALAVEFWNDTLCIRQLQGVGGASIPEDLRHWPNMFVEACCLFARKANFKRVRLYRANQSLFYAYPDVSKVPLEKQIEEVSAIRKRMTRRYDYTAEQAGFVMMPRWGEWTNLKVRH
ncbi:MAG: hypothetical protein JWN64_55 [Parcubacteria group bacterium]|nr:hypothetical protein [Parcubacteria group bacterium]